MKNLVLIGLILQLISGCKSPIPVVDQKSKVIGSLSYLRQIENIEKKIYYRAEGAKGQWILKLSEDRIELSTSINGFKTFSSGLIQSVYNKGYIKTYIIRTDTTTVIITLKPQFFSSKSLVDTVKIQLLQGKRSYSLRGSGSYITDYRLHDIWVLQELNGMQIEVSDFHKGLPNIEINSSKNTFMGYTGCQEISGTIQNEKELLRFSLAIPGKSSCLADSTIAAYVQALQLVTTYKIQNNRLTLFSDKNEELIFRKVD